MEEGMVDAFLNVSPNQILQHRLILAFKCFAFLNWINMPDISWFQMAFLYFSQMLKSNRVQTLHVVEAQVDSSDRVNKLQDLHSHHQVSRTQQRFQHDFNSEHLTLLLMLVIFLASDGSIPSKFWSFTLYLILLLMQHKKVNDVVLYFFCFGACLLCDRMQLIIDEYLLREYCIIIIILSGSPVPFLAVSMFVWCILPFEKLFTLFYCVYIARFLIFPQPTYLIFSYLLACLEILCHYDTNIPSRIDSTSRGMDLWKHFREFFYLRSLRSC